MGYNMLYYAIYHGKPDAISNLYLLNIAEQEIRCVFDDN